MNTDDLRIRSTQTRLTAPMDYAARRLSSLLALAGASLGLAGAVLAEAAGAPIEAAIGFGLVVFLTGTALGDSVAWRIRRRLAPSKDRKVEAGPRIKTHESSGRRDALGWGSSTQLGPDPEQVIGRKTGARI